MSFATRRTALRATAEATGATIARLISAATTNATSVKASPGQVYGWELYNTNAAPRYLKLYNLTTSPVVGTDVPYMTILIPGSASGAGNNERIPEGVPFNAGIAYALTSGMADGNTGAVGATEVIVNLHYK